jgi:hypothetical protein
MERVGLMEKIFWLMYFQFGLGMFLGAWYREDHKNLGSFMAAIIMGFFWPAILMSNCTDKMFHDQ